MTQIYDPTRDLLGPTPTPAPAVQESRDPMDDGVYSGNAGKTVEDLKTAAINDADKKFSDLLDGEEGPCGPDCECFEQNGALGARRAQAEAARREREENPILDVVTKLLKDIDAAMSAVIQERASSVLIERTLRDGANDSRKMLVSFQVEMVATDEFEDADPTDGFRLNDDSDSGC